MSVSMAFLFFGGMVAVIFAMFHKHESWSSLLAFSGVGVMAISGIVNTANLSDSKSAEIRFRFMYEVSDPCRLNYVDWCDSKECQAVVRCEVVKRSAE
jgi:hypothetical protein